MIDTGRLRKLLALAHKNDKNEEAIRALRLALRVAKDHACAPAVAEALEAAEADLPENRDLAVDRALNAAGVSGSPTDGRYDPFVYTEGASDSDAGTEVGQLWRPGEVVKNTTGRGWRVCGYSPGFYSPLMSKDDAEHWAASWKRSGNGAFATGWDDDSHLPEEPEDEQRRLAAEIDALIADVSSTSDP